MNDFCHQKRENALTITLPPTDFGLEAGENDDEIYFSCFKTRSQPVPNAMNMTNWGFGQIAALAKSPAGYLRNLPAALTAECINHNLFQNREETDVKFLVDTHTQELRAATGPNYGRIWNADIIAALIARFGNGIDGDWRVPGIFGKELTTITKENTTLYASDRDMFVFLADEKNRIEIKNRRNNQPGTLARGFFVWNSEEGRKRIGLACFLFDYICGNRLVWGAEGYEEFSTPHTLHAPERWLNEILPVLNSYQKAETTGICNTIAIAQDTKINNLDALLETRFGKQAIIAIKAAHQTEEQRPIETLWDVVTGITAYAKTIPFQDKRVDIEIEASKLLASS